MSQMVRNGTHHGTQHGLLALNDREFWCNTEIDKIQIENLSDQLERRAKTGRPMRHYRLAHCRLQGINLVKPGAAQGYELSDSDFYHADLQNAHLFGIDLSHSSLVKADLRNANLHCANLQDCNLLGVKLSGAKLEHIHWGKHILQEKQAKVCLKEGDTDQALDLLEQSEEIYRNLRLNLENDGLFETAGYFFHKEMQMRRLQMPFWSSHRAISKFVDLVSGYGEKPQRVIIFSSLMILLCACLYFAIGLQQDGVALGFSFDANRLENLRHFFISLYFSVVTFTTLGYGDITPVGWVRPVAAAQAFIGSFTIALFVVVFVKKMTR